MLKFIILLICIQQIIATTSTNYELSFPKRANWTTATKACEDEGYALVSIETIEKQIEIEEFLKGENAGGKIRPIFRHQIWTSGTKPDGNDNFEWPNIGKTLTYTKWANGEPTNYNNHYKTYENCIALRYMNSTFIEWNDSVCSFEYFYLCEEIDDEPESKDDFPSAV